MAPDHDASTPAAHVVLIGLMGSGKSTVGRLVAERLGRTFVDVDEVIEARTGMTVRQLWERGGEVAYRPLERDIVIEVLCGDRSDVIAVPAGAVEDPLVRETIEWSPSFTVWLRGEVTTLASRVGSSGHRPLLGTDPIGVLTAQAAERAATYAALADLVLDVEGHSPEELADTVVAAVER
jgi:shikimate kinase